MRRLAAVLIFVTAILMIVLLACFNVIRRTPKDPIISNVGNRDLPQKGHAFQPFAFAVMGDIQNGLTVLKEWVGRVNADSDIDFVVQTGDFVNHGDEGHFLALGSAFQDVRSRVPIRVVPGNHDLDRDPEQFERFFGPRSWTMLYHRCAFVGLDYTISSSTLEEILRKFQDQNLHHIFVFTHLPPPEDHLSVLIRHRVRAVFSGHAHRYQESRRDGLLIVVNGQGGDYGHEGYPESYLTKVCVAEDGIKLGRWSVPGRLTWEDYVKHLALGHVWMGWVRYRMAAIGLIGLVLAIHGCSWIVLLRKRAR